MYKRQRQEDFDALPQRLAEHVDGLDGALHSIGFAPQPAFDFQGATWELSLIHI